nr:MAG TPA: hypothetical protein [Caudoviricetes sp.]
MKIIAMNCMLFFTALVCILIYGKASEKYRFLEFIIFIQLLIIITLFIEIICLCR